MDSKHKTKRQINFREDQIETLRIHKEKTGIPMNAAVRVALDAYFQNLNCGEGIKNERNTSNCQTESAAS